MTSRSLHNWIKLEEDKDGEILKLKARMYDCQNENEELRRQLEQTRAELKETQALLGQACTASARLTKQKAFTVENRTVPPPRRPVVKSQEREVEMISERQARSPSIEIIEPPVSSRGQPTEEKIAKVENLRAPSVKPVNNSHFSSGNPTTISDDEKMGRAKKRIKLEGTSEKSNEDMSNGIIVVSRPPSTRPISQPNMKAETKNPAKPRMEANYPIDPETNAGETISDEQNTAAPTATNMTVATSTTDLKQRPMKGSKTALTLPASVAELYLGPTPSLAIEPPPLNLEVPRTFLRVAYGGSDQQFLQYIQPERNPSGLFRRRIVFPTLTLNPLMPSSPGMRGLVFASRREILDNGPWTLFCKRSSAAPAVWLYVGEYVNTLAGTMKAEEFRQQTLTVQREWAAQLMNCKLHDVYVAMRARIALRLAGLLPVTDKVGAEKEEEETRIIDSEILAVKGGRGHPVSKEDIVEAFCRGEEAIDVVRMQCVEYDHVFAEDMRTKYLTYPELLKADKAKKDTPKTAKVGGRKRKTVASARSQKTQHDDDPESDSESDKDAWSVEDFDGSYSQTNPQVTQRRAEPYGTRSKIAAS